MPERALLDEGRGNRVLIFASCVMPNDARPSLTAIAARPRLRRAIMWLAGIVLAYSAIGFLLLPRVVKPMLEHALSSALARQVTIERLTINPYALSATLTDIAVGERGEGPPLLTLSELYANAEAASVFRWAPVVSALKLTRPALHLVRNADRSYNVSDLIEQALAAPPGPPPSFSISNIEVEDGRIEFDDRPDHRQHQLTDLELGIPFLSSLPTQTEIKVEPFFSALLNGRRVAVTGETRPFKETHETMLHWELSGVPLPTYVDYVPVTLPVKLPSGILDGEISLRFVGRGREPPQLTITGTARLADLVLTDRAGHPLLRVPSLSVALDRLDPIGGSADFRSITVDGMHLELLRTQTGGLNLAALASTNAPSTSPGPPFKFHVGNFALIHGTVRVADEAVTPSYVATLNDVAADIANLGNAAEQKATVALSFTTDIGEHLTHRGTLALSPLLADGRLEVTGLKLKRLFPYYASALNLAVDDGTLDLASDVRFSAAGANPGLTFANLGATVSALKMRLSDEKEQLWHVPMLAVRGGSVDVDKRAIHFDSVEGRGAAASVRRGSDGRINFARLIRTPEGGASAATSEETWRVEASKVALDDFSATFVDETVTPPARIALSRVAVAAENLSNGAKAMGRASVQATVNKRGTLSLTGPLTTAPFAGKLGVTARNVDLVPFQPYIAQSARVVFTSGAASMKGTLDFATGTAPRAAFKGDLVLRDVAALDEANGTDLLKWKSLTAWGHRCAARATRAERRRYRARRILRATHPERERRVQPATARARSSVGWPVVTAIQPDRIDEDRRTRHASERGDELAQARQGKPLGRHGLFHRPFRPAELFGQPYRSYRQPVDTRFRSSPRISSCAARCSRRRRSKSWAASTRWHRISFSSSGQRRPTSSSLRFRPIRASMSAMGSKRASSR